MALGATSNAARGLNSIHDRHLPVENYDVKRTFLELVDGGPTILQLAAYAHFRILFQKRAQGKGVERWLSGFMKP